MNFYLSTWEEFYTHKLFLSEFSGPVEGIFMLMALFIATGLTDTQTVWKNEIFGYSYTFYLCTFGGFFLFFNIYSAKRNVDQYLAKTGEKHNLIKTLSPFFLYYGSVYALLFLHNDVVYEYATQMMLSIGSTIAFTVGRIIVAHLTKQDYPMFNFPMLTPVFQIVFITLLTSVFSFDYDEALKLVVYAGMGLTFGIHACFIIDIIYSITKYLDIYALTIKHQKVF
ncbi:unnamed protein product [Ambrosiozyma monospora]|uniref:Unnamed protein product n=1 Tax=Ambrosiozyma monospora TaxID=43982 RepID=A0ACB5U2U5_AMBMO|nr:unnamed protein product [Ambrosiozyma monospora]